MAQFILRDPPNGENYKYWFPKENKGEFVVLLYLGRQLKNKSDKNPKWEKLTAYQRQSIVLAINDDLKIECSSFPALPSSPGDSPDIKHPVELTDKEYRHIWDCSDDLEKVFEKWEEGAEEDGIYDVGAWYLALLPRTEDYTKYLSSTMKFVDTTKKAVDAGIDATKTAAKDISENVGKGAGAAFAVAALLVGVWLWKKS